MKNDRISQHKQLNLLKSPSPSITGILINNVTGLQKGAVQGSDQPLNVISDFLGCV